MKSKARMGFSISFVDADESAEYEWSHILWHGKKENEPTQWRGLESIE